MLCMDTCSLLDLMRDSTPPKMNSTDYRAAHALLRAAQRDDLVVLVADQVTRELADHAGPIEMGLAKAVNGLIHRIQFFEGVMSEFGAIVPVDLSPLATHVANARTFFDAWLAVGAQAPESALAPGKAWYRVHQAIAPATKGKESIKDCIVVETYLEAVTRLRGHGLAERVVLLSSNTQDFCDSGKNLRPELEAEFLPLGIEYARNYQSAKAFLGL